MTSLEINPVFPILLVLPPRNHYGDRRSPEEYHEAPAPPLILMRLPFPFLLTMTLLSIAMAGCTPSPLNEVMKPEVPETPNTRSLQSWIPYWDQENAFASFREHAELFDAVSLSWYRLDAAGNVTTYEATQEDTSIIDFAHEQNIKVFALVANLPDYMEGGGWDPQRVDRVIATPEARARHISDLVRLAEEHAFDGIDIDYEALEGRQRENYTRFIEELSYALHAKGKLLGIAIHPKTSESNPMEDNGSHAQDWKALSLYADRMYFMLFGEHYSGGEPGPVASLDWIESVLRYAVNVIGIPPEKIVAELPFYAVEWTEEKPGQFAGMEEELTLRDAEELRRQQNATEQWDEEPASPFFTYKKDGREVVVWLENARSLQAKLALAKQYGISTISYWRLGGETEKMWEVLQMTGN